MKYLILAATLAACLAQQAPQMPMPKIITADMWKKATQFPDVDLTGLSPDQKRAVLTLLKEENCTCGCGMKMAECRMKDPKCAFSRMSAHAAVQAIRDGKSPDAVRTAALAENHLKTLDDKVKINTAGSPSKGPAGARITLVEFSDFQCPYCSKAVRQIDEVLRRHPGDVRLVFKQYPIAVIHSQAYLAAKASLAANQQGKFWLMHDAMFANGGKLTRENILLWAKQMNMDMPRFTKDMDSPQTGKAVDTDIAEAENIGVIGTPTVFLNGQRYNGELDPETFGKIVDDQLKK